MWNSHTQQCDMPSIHFPDMACYLIVQVGVALRMPLLYDRTCLSTMPFVSTLTELYYSHFQDKLPQK